MLKVADILARANDLRIDQSPGNKDINTDGISALNAAIDYLLNKHYWPLTVRGETVRVYPTVEKYGITTNAKEIKTFRKVNGSTRDFDRVSPTTITNHMRHGNSNNEIAFERGLTPCLYVNAMATDADYVDNYLTLSNSTDEPITLGAGLDNLEVLSDYDYDGDDVVSFSLVGETSASATITHTAKDLTDNKAISAVFCDLLIPDYTELASITLLLSDNTGKTIAKTCTTTFDGQLVNGNIALNGSTQTFGIELTDLSKITKTSGFDYTNVIALAVTLNVATPPLVAPIHNIILSNVRLASYEPYLLETYTTAMVKDVSTGLYQTHVVAGDTNDLIMMHDEQLEFVSYIVAWKLLEMMDRQALKEDRRMIVEGQYGTSGMVAKEMEKYPALVKKYSGPSIVAC